MRVDGSKAVWNFSKKSSDLVAGPFPKQLTSESHDEVQGEFHRNAKVGLRWNDDLASLGAKCGQMLRVHLGISSSGALCPTFSPHFHIGESRATHRCLIHWAGPGSFFRPDFLTHFFGREGNDQRLAGGRPNWFCCREACDPAPVGRIDPTESLS